MRYKGASMDMWQLRHALLAKQEARRARSWWEGRRRVEGGEGKGGRGEGGRGKGGGGASPLPTCDAQYTNIRLSN